MAPGSSDCLQVEMVSILLGSFPDSVAAERIKFQALVTIIGRVERLT